MRYERYKRIDLPWLREVPDHWKVVRNKHVLLPQTKIVGDHSPDYVLLSLTLRGIIERDLESGKGKFPESFDKYKVVNREDLIFCLFDIDETPRTVGVSKNEGMITGAYDVYKSINVNPDFLAYYWINVDNKKALKPYYKSLRKTITSDSFLRIAMPLPPVVEQEQIANFLDWKINEIDKTIEIELKKINAAKNLKKTILQEVIMKENLGENYKKSGLLWIEKIPITWEVKKVKQLLEKKVKEATYEDETVICSNHGYSFLRGEQKIGLLSDDINMYQKVSKGQIMVHGMDTWHGAICISNHDGKCTKVVHVCESKENYEYIVYYLRLLAFIGMYKPYSDGVRQNTSDFRSWSKLGTIDVLLPPRKEQDEIVRRIKDVEEICDNIIISAKKIIEENTLLKQSIISEVVTGQIDIRNIDIPEYEKVESVFEEDEDQVEGGEDEWD